jgi:hypothetical protein
VIFFEHVAAAPNTLAKRAQDLVNPLWNLFSGGCNCNRDTLDVIHEQTNWRVTAWELKLDFPLVGRIMCGVAEKQAKSDASRL